jgi:hypothetical protein
MRRLVGGAGRAILAAGAPAGALAQDEGPASSSGPGPVVPTPPSPSASASPAAASPAPTGEGQTMVLREGDVVAGERADGQIRIMKILKIVYIEGDRLLHALCYKESFKSYDEAAAAHAKKVLTIAITHVPIDGEGLTPDSNKVLGNEPVTEPELVGYKEYLKEMGQ